MLGSKDIFLDRAKRELSVMQMNHCGIQECEKGHMWQFQARPYHLLHFVLQGEGSLKISGRMLNVHAGQAFFIPAGIEGKYIASLQNPWKYAWIGFYADNGNKFIDLLFGKNEILDLALSAKELEKEILSILSVMDKRLQDVAIYQEEDFPGEQFFSIRNFSASLEANSRMLHLFARLLETQGDIKKLTKEEKNLAKDAKNYMDRMYSRDIRIQDVAGILHVHPNYLSKTFSGKSTFIDLKTCIFNQSSIRRDHITCFKKNHISYNQFSCRKLYRHTITQYLCLRTGKLL